MNELSNQGINPKYSEEYIGLLLVSFEQRGFVRNCNTEEIEILVKNCLRCETHFVMKKGNEHNRFEIYRHEVFQMLEIEGEIIFDSTTSDLNSYEFELEAMNRFSM